MKTVPKQVGRSILAQALAAIALCFPAGAQTVLIGEGVGNGHFADTSNPRAQRKGGTPLEVVTTPPGRAMTSMGESGAFLKTPGWTATRIALSGGNSAFGYDVSEGTGPKGFRSVGEGPYAFINGGVVVFEADEVQGPFAAEDLFTLDFGGFNSDGNAEGVLTATLTFDNGESFSFDPMVLPAEKNAMAMLSDAGNNTYQLRGDAKTVVLSIELDTTRSSQITLDSVTLTVGPSEPPGPPEPE